MKLYSMTATFGKLDHETLTLNPGLNVLLAPNEWGKSTWCAFLLAMLYGLDSRGKTTRNALSEKDRYTPWSGKPMSGRIDLNWNGRDVTIERTTPGRVPLGSFQAYETATGLAIPELNAANCGQKLLGIEQSVYRRAGFIRLTDLPVTQDEALRRRLNDLVTTGDESGDSIRLEEGIRELKNRCRLNKRSGLLPQAEARREAIDSTLDELQALSDQRRALQERIAANEAREQELLNHRAALEYTQAQTDWQQVQQAETVLKEGEAALETLRSRCQDFPVETAIQEELSVLETFRKKIIAVNGGFSALPPLPKAPEAPSPLRGIAPSEVEHAVQQDCRTMEAAGKPQFPLLLGLVLFSAGAALCFKLPLLGLPVTLIGIGLGIWGGIRKKKDLRIQKELTQKYDSPFPALWLEQAHQYSTAYKQFESEQNDYRKKLDEQNARLDALQQEHAALCPHQTMEQRISQLHQMQMLLTAKETAEKNVQAARSQYETLKTMARSIEAPQQPDSLTLSLQETLAALQQVRQEHQHLLSRAGVYAGRMDALGTPEALRSEKDTLNRRIQKLEDTYAALTLAQQTLAEATAKLQQRFAPRITRRAQALFSEMTQGRYDRVKLGEDFGLQSATQQEDTLHDILWRSDGTIDQLYLSLRLAVAEALTPEAPLILDDALVRFDEERMKSAMTILSQIGQSKQIILFTCQKREQEALTGR